MRQTEVILMVLSGLCFLGPSFPHRYILVELAKNWYDARTYCRDKYTDLAVVQNAEDLERLNDVLVYSFYAWIGLHSDPRSWRWSLKDQDYYGEGEARFRMWDDDKPGEGAGYHVLCVAMTSNGKWEDVPCDEQNYFFCYKKATSSVSYVEQSMSWFDAQSYCREHHTDLASVRNRAENNQMMARTVTVRSWIGLYRDGWKWSDGSPVRVTNWDLGQPSSKAEFSCAVFYWRWGNKSCMDKYNFACYIAVKNWKLVKVVVKSDPSVDMEKLQEGLMEKFNLRVKELNLDLDVQLRWAKQPDGKIFHLEKEDKTEKEETSSSS